MMNDEKKNCWKLIGPLSFIVLFIYYGYVEKIQANVFEEIQNNVEEQVSTLNASEEEIITLKDEDYDFDALYLYVPMVLKAPERMIAHEKVIVPVRLQLTQDGLTVRRENASNDDMPFLKIGGRHFDPRCRQHFSKTCIQENGTSLSWHEKRFLLLKLQEMTFFSPYSISKPFDPMAIWNVDDFPCLRKMDSDLEHYSIEKETISFQVKNTYRISPSVSCMPNIEHIGRSGEVFQVVFKHTFKRLSDLASVDYQKIDYPYLDQRTFGFFETRLSYGYNGNNYLMRWNPHRKIIQFHLSDFFNDTKQKRMKEITYSVFDRVNQALDQAKTGLQVELLESSEKQFGDLSVNMVQLFSEYKQGPLGGKALIVDNPLTGEIVQADIVMYTSLYSEDVPQTWNEMRDIARFEKRNQQAEYLLNDDNSVEENFVELSKKHKIGETVPNHFPPLNSFETTSDAVGVPAEGRNSNVCAYNISNFSVAKSLISRISELSEVFDEHGVFKKWHELGQEEQKIAKEIIVSSIYGQFLLHEIAHVLGLRHNFLGSFDEKNFYSLEEAKELGLESAPPYSSIADYLVRDDLSNNVGVYGKYDIAALRFGYAREVEVYKGNSETETEFISVGKSLQDAASRGFRFKTYLYCNDEQVESIAYCNKGDKGTNVSDVARNQLKANDIYYKKKNFRNDRHFISSDDVEKYVQKRRRFFNSLNGLYDLWYDLVYSHGMRTMVYGCPSSPGRPLSPRCKEINRHRDAINMAGDFLLKTLAEPEYSCIHTNIIDDNAPPVFTTMVYIYHQLESNVAYVPKSCFDPVVKNYFARHRRKVIAEGGRYINSFNDAYGLYTIGNWMDRFLAVNALFKRSHAGGGLADHPVFGPKIAGVFSHLLLGDPAILSGSFRQENGEEIILDYILPSTQALSGPFGKGSDRIRQFFDLPETDSSWYVKSLLQQVVNSGSDYETQNLYTIRRNDIAEGVPSGNLAYFTLNDTVYSASPTNFMAYKMINAYHDFIFLRRLTREVMETSVERRNLPARIPNDLDEDLQAIYNLEDGHIDYLLSVARRGEILDFQRLLGRYNYPLGIMLYRGHILGEKKLRRVRSIRRNQAIPTEFLPLCYSGTPPCPWGDVIGDENVDSDIFKLYNTDLETVKNFLSGELEMSVRIFLSRINLFPDHVSY